MLPKRLRLKVGKIGNRPVERLVSGNFTVKVFNPDASSGPARPAFARLRTGRPVNRFAVLVPKKAAKKSSKRNFIKRKVSGALRLWQNFGKDFVVVAAPGADLLGKREISEQMNFLEAQTTLRLNEEPRRRAVRYRNSSVANPPSLLRSFGRVLLAIHPRRKRRGILAKENKETRD
mgnify:CR=1 FL=1